MIKRLLFIPFLFICSLTYGALGTPTNLDATATTSTSITSNSVSPTGDALLKVFCGSNTPGSATTHSMSDSFSDSITWTEQETNTQTVLRGTLFIGTGLSSSPGSGTVTCTFGSNSRGGLIIDEITGYDSTPVSESNNNAQLTGTTNSVSLSDISGNNITWGGVVNISAGSPNVTPGTNETELAEASTTGLVVQTQHGTETTFDCSTLDDNDSIILAAEIVEEVTATRRIILVH